MELALLEYLLPKLLAIDLDITAESNQHLYLMFMRSLKKAKEMLNLCLLYVHVLSESWN